MVLYFLPAWLPLSFLRVIGTLLNAGGILLGGILGLKGHQLSAQNQAILKLAIGVSTVFVGLRMTWISIGGTFAQMTRQMTIVLLALILGKITGRILHLQKGVNKIGQQAREIMNRPKPSPAPLADGFMTCSIVFCFAPLAFLGAVQDGLGGFYYALAIKAVMDGLATMAFATMFGWGVLLSIIPVLAVEGTLTLLSRLLKNFLESHALVDPIYATSGMLVFCVALIIFEIKKIELADYLPSLAFAPLIAYLWR